MCGIVGVINKHKNGFSKDQCDAMAQLLYANQLRGKDGTGIFFNYKKNTSKVKVLRGPVPGSIFVQNKEFDNAMRTAFQESNFMIGHNRAATKGEISALNTHPFREKHIVLVHNGTLTDHKKLKDVEVDSHAIAHSIAEVGSEATLKKLDGAFALVWFNSQEGTLNLVRNWQRPLNIIECDTCFIICSEAEMGLWIAKRCELKHVKTIEVTPKKLIQFHIDDMTKFTEKDVEFKSFVYETKPNHFWNGYQSSNNNHKSSTPIYKNGKRIYAFGETIRFKAGIIRYTNNQVPYLEGDICKYQSLTVSNIEMDKDYEDEWRVRIFASIDKLRTFTHAKFIKGKIAQVVTHNDTYTYYTINDFELEASDDGKIVNNNVIQLPAARKAECFCELCGKSFDASEGQYFSEYWSCPSCIRQCTEAYC